jgi:hypothetical protein
VSDLRGIDSRPTGWHQLNIGHLVMGLAFLGIVGIWALVQTDTVTGDDIRWLLPIPWVVAGVTGLAATAITGPRRYAVRQTGWVGDQPPLQPADLSEGAVDETAPIIPETKNDEETS